MRRLAEAGLTTREACGNSVRNITACPYAGVAADERFDVTPYAEALTRYLLRHPLSLDAAAQVQDRVRGLRGRSHRDAASTTSASAPSSAPGGGRGFRVTAGGGTAIMCDRAAGLLHEFLPASEILRVAEAVLRVFHRLGDYQHKQRNRMKFLIKTLGWDAVARGIRPGADRAAGCAARCRRSRSIRPPPKPRPDWTPGPSPSRRSTSPAACRRRRVDGPGLTPVVVPVLHAGDEAYRALARDQRAPAEAVRLRSWRSPPCRSAI